jgi:membrane protease YdiL (CAAX protease family)
MGSSPLPEDNSEHVPPTASSAYRDQAPLRLMFAALIWFLAGLLAQFGLGIFAGIAAGFHHGLVGQGGEQPWIVLLSILRVLSVGVLQITLLVASWRRGLLVGRGNRRLGLGINPLRRPGLLIGLIVSIAPIVICWTFLIGRFVPKAPDSVLAEMLSGSTSTVTSKIGLLFIVGALAPHAEEWFYRGWLWTGLSRHWSTSRVAATTGCLWLAPHMLDGSTRPVFLIPLVISLSVARCYCGSLRASFILHVVNNTIFLALTLAAG